LISTTTILQIVIMLAVLTCLAWIAMQPSRRRGARRPSNDNSWSSDAIYGVADSGQHHGSSGHSGSDTSSASGDSAGGSDSGGGSDGGGSGGDGGGGGSSD
jgi:hypothetical protein